jgi:hypothetical protein
MRGKFDPGVGKVSVLHLVRVLPWAYQIISYLWKYHVYHERWNSALVTKQKIAENGNVNVSTR